MDVKHPCLIDTLNQQRPNNIMGSTAEPLRNGQEMEQLNTCDQRQTDNGYMGSPMETQVMDMFPSSMDESLPESNSITSDDSSMSSKRSTQDVLPSPIVLPDLTTTAPVLNRFYDSRLKSVYDMFTYPTETDSVGSAMNSSNIYSTTTEQQLKLTNKMNSLPQPNRPSLQTTSFLSSQFSALGCTEREVEAAVDAPVGEKRKKVPFQRQTELQGHLRTYKIKMFPTHEQKVELKRTFGMARYAYNWAIAQMKADKKPNNIQLRNEFRKLPLPHWASEKKKQVATRITAAAIKQAVDAVVTNLKKKKKDPSHHFEMTFRSKIANSEVVNIEKAANGGSLVKVEAYTSEHLPSRAGRKNALLHFGNNLKQTGPILIEDNPNVIDMFVAEGKPKEDGKILYDRRRNTYYYIYLYEQPALRDPDPEFLDKDIVCTDPGEVVFQTFYSPSGSHGEILLDFRQVLLERCKKLDILHSRVIKKENLRRQGLLQGRKNYLIIRRLKQVWARERARLSAFVERAHYFAANYILKNYDIIIQPQMAVSKMVSDLNSKVARSMLTMSHYMYNRRLEWASTRYAGRYVVHANEPGTSKTCTNCGYWHADLGTSRTFKCPKCSIVVARDLAGARNNCLHAIGTAIRNRQLSEKR